jgi:hypothetical protein
MAEPPPVQRSSWPERVNSFALVGFTAALVFVSFLQYLTLDSQKRIQEAATRSNVAPSYGGKSTEQDFVLNMTNTGAIPARGVTVMQSAGVFASEDDLAALCARPVPAGNPVTIHPGRRVEHHVTAPSEEEIKALAGRHYAFCGAISYRDELGDALPSDFCFAFSESELNDPVRTSNTDHTICAPGHGAS